MRFPDETCCTISAKSKSSNGINENTIRPDDG